ncbi:hypothetical protein L9F63_021268, partial [Diploptera punctata]
FINGTGSQSEKEKRQYKNTILTIQEAPLSTVTVVRRGKIGANDVARAATQDRSAQHEPQENPGTTLLCAVCPAGQPALQDDLDVEAKANGSDTYQVRACSDYRT